MWKYLLACSVSACGVGVYGFYNQFISKGRWVVDRMERCENYASYSCNSHLHKRKVNRTHDGFYGEMELREDITEDDFGLLIECCIKVDGGCRPVATFADESLCRFLTHHAGDNFKSFLRNMGVEEHCPIPKGFYKLKDYLFDNREIAEDGMVGNFLATIKVLKHDKKITCIAIHLHFDKVDEDYDD